MENFQVRKKLAELRKRKNATQQEIAEFLGYKTAKAYYELESGRRELKVRHLEKLSNFFSVPIDYFFDDK